jgi:hypothetical protein
MFLRRTIALLVLGCVLVSLKPLRAAEKEATPRWSKHVQTVLDVTKPLESSRGGRLPLYLWPAMDPGNLDDATAEELVKELDRRGVGLVCSWSPGHHEASLKQALPVARAQTKLGMPVGINATGCLHSFFNGDPVTAHVDAEGKPFWDDSFGGGKMGCPFALESRKDPIRQQVEAFVRAYREAGVKVDFVFADWEIDGPIEFNRAHETSKKCTRCRSQFQDIDNFLEFQKSLREIRSELQRYAFTEPVLSQFPKALVGNYAVYPHNGYRYWYDYFESYVDGQPAITDQQAKYRHWANEFAGTGYTFAMPVVYTWYGIYNWYDFENSDYRWFYAMLLEASSVGQQTPANVPIISFVHWHTTAPPKDADPKVKQMSPTAYQELLWHMLLRGTDTFYLWCMAEENIEECRLLHEVYAAAQQYGDFLERGTPVSFQVPKTPGAVVSGLRLGNRVLVRRTDFGGSTEPVELLIGSKRLAIPAVPGQCQILTIP